MQHSPTPVAPSSSSCSKNVQLVNTTSNQIYLLKCVTPSDENVTTDEINKSQETDRLEECCCLANLNLKDLTSEKSRSKHDLASCYGFNEDQIGIFEETFQIFDKDCDGFITLIEIRTVMNALGFYPSDEDIRNCIQRIDNDNSGTVDFEEFIGMMAKFRQFKTSNELEEELMDIFNIFDKNRDGFIDNEELKTVLLSLGENITDDEISDMIREADIDGDNKVSYTEFKSMLYDNKSR